MSTISLPAGATDHVRTIVESQGNAITEAENSLLLSVKGNTTAWGACSSALIVKYSLQNHAVSLNNAASKSEANAKALSKYTLCLAIATVALVLVGVAQLIATLRASL